MSSTAHKTAEEYREFIDKPEVLERKVELLAQMVRSSKHFIAFTGAGVSTSAGIPDFRSGVNTVLDTGAGVWTQRAVEERTGKQFKHKSKRRVTSTMKAIATPTHMALVQLQKANLLKFLISQNTDGLHRRSGFPRTHLAELHGNTNLEVCKRCGHQYLRDYRTRTARRVHDHETGRMCTKDECGGMLHDSIINFGENLPETELQAGFQHSREADLCLAMGSSLRVTPAADMPAEVGENPNANLVIVNLQSTPLDDVATLRINGKTDDVMRLLMQKLELPIPEFRLRRFITLSHSVTKDNKQRVKSCELRITSHEADSTPTSMLAGAAVLSPVDDKHVIAQFRRKGRYARSKIQFTMQQQRQLDAMRFAKAGASDDDGKEETGEEEGENLSSNQQSEKKKKKKKKKKKNKVCTVRIDWMGHYNEPSVLLDCYDDTMTVGLEYNPMKGTWTTVSDE